MTVWVIRGGLYEEEAMEHGTTSIDYAVTRDLSGAHTPDDVRTMVRIDLPHEGEKRLGQITGQLWSFKSRIEIGDLIVMPRKGQPTIAIGEMAGDYVFLADRPQHKHSRTVNWISREVARNSLAPDLKRSIATIVTVFRPLAQDAEARLRAIAEGSIPPIPLPDDESDGADEVEFSVNLEEDANHRIRDYIGGKFPGHAFTRLVAAVLQAQGYVVEVAPPGRDVRVDIVAGSGAMGFDPPRMCVQVQSGVQATQVGVLRALEGSLTGFGADFGLLVSWGGFPESTLHVARNSSYFNVRLWDSEAFLNALFQNYERLPADLQADLPLKRAWILDEPTL